MLCHTAPMTSPQTAPPVMRRRLGSLLRRYRKRSAMTLVQAAAVLGWESTRLSRVETGQYQIKAGEVATLLKAYGVTDQGEVSGITGVAESHQRKWWAAYSDVLPRPYADSIALEEAAVSIKTYFPQLITALLQTPAYAHSAIFSSPSPAVRKNADSLVQVRQARKMVLTRSENPARLDTVIDESALFAPSGATPDVMRDQLLGLLDLSERDNVTIRVMPLGAPAHPGLTSNMTVMDFRPPWPPVVLIDHLRGGVFLEDAEDVDAFAMAFDAVVDAALDVDASREVIKSYMKGKTP
ncbi:helix-turn-helix transcriptional regulator [Streptomyces sp. NPDC048723]|uniref:helix-turn-helix domain-containing protein n=1 Tax=Streptomyces sp. NPDC048723 TaxID=3365589 RepID=UPI00371647E2